MRLLHHTGKLPNIVPLQNHLKKLKNIHAGPQHKMHDVQYLSKYFTFATAEHINDKGQELLDNKNKISTQQRKLKGNLK